MIIDEEKAFLDKTPKAEIFKNGTSYFSPNFLHGMQMKKEKFEEYAEYIKNEKGETGITVEPDWNRWDDPHLFDDTDEYFNVCRDTFEILRKKGMYTWIYDEPGYPSGGFGICVMEENSGLIQTGIEMKAVSPGDAVSDMKVFAVDSEKFKAIGNEEKCNGKMYGFRVVPLIKGTISHISRRHRLPDERFNEQILYGYPNLLDKRAAELFIKKAYEPYKKHLGEYLGKEVKAIFTDEPIIPFRHYYAPETAPALPWCENFDGLYKDMYGEDISEKLPQLFLNIGDYKVTRWKYWRLVSQLFAENFVRTAAQWCRETGMYFTGHFLHEEILATQVLCSGSLLKASKEMTMPGSDNLSMGFAGRGVGIRLSTVGGCSHCGEVLPKIISSAAHLTGKARTASESHGWSQPSSGTSYSGYIGTANWQMSLGINTLPYYTMDFRGATDEQRKKYHEYISRISYMTSGGKHITSTAVLYPIAGVWANITPCDEDLPSLAGLGPLEREHWHYCRNEKINTLQNIFDDTCKNLLSLKNDFDYVEEEDVESSIFENHCMNIGGRKYSSVLVCGCDFISGNALRKLEEAAANGIRVIVGGIKPTASDDEAQLKNFLNNDKIRFVENVEEACGYIAENSDNIRLSPHKNDIYAIHIKKEKADIYFISNHSYSDWEGAVYFPSAENPCLWDARSGKIYPLFGEICDDGCKIKLKLRGCTAKTVVFGSDEKTEDAEYKEYIYPIAQTGEQLAYEFDRITREKYFGDTKPKLELCKNLSFGLHAPYGGMSLCGDTLNIESAYRPGEAIEGMKWSGKLEPGVYRVSMDAECGNITGWGIMPRHFDENGDEIIESGFNESWRQELSINRSHEKANFSLYFEVPAGAEETHVMVCPACKEMFLKPAFMKITESKLERADI